MINKRFEYVEKHDNELLTANEWNNLAQDVEDVVDTINNFLSWKSIGNSITAYTPYIPTNNLYSKNIYIGSKGYWRIKFSSPMTTTTYGNIKLSDDNLLEELKDFSELSDLLQLEQLPGFLNSWLRTNWKGIHSNGTTSIFNELGFLPLKVYNSQNKEVGGLFILYIETEVTLYSSKDSSPGDFKSATISDIITLVNYFKTNKQGPWASIQ